jgi:hypothetical protein
LRQNTEKRGQKKKVIVNPKKRDWFVERNQNREPKGRSCKKVEKRKEGNEEGEQYRI